MSRCQFNCSASRISRIDVTAVKINLDFDKIAASLCSSASVPDSALPPGCRGAGPSHPWGRRNDGIVSYVAYRNIIKNRSLRGNVVTAAISDIYGLMNNHRRFVFMVKGHKLAHVVRIIERVHFLHAFGKKTRSFGG